MSDDAPTGGSLADRVSKPDPKAEPFQPKSGSSWADEVASPATEEPPSIENLKLDQAAESSPAPAIPQTDGASGTYGGSSLHEPDYQVEVKLADMQADPNNPLYSATSFEQLGL